MLSDSVLEEIVRKSILIYNRLHSPQVTVKLVFLSSPLLTVEFSGGLCYECSTLDYTEGFAHQFKALTSKAEIKTNKTRQINPRAFQTDYTIKTK